MFIDLGLALPDSFYSSKSVSSQDWAPVVSGKFNDSILNIWSSFPKIENVKLSWLTKNTPQTPGLDKYRNSGCFTVLRRLTVKISDSSQNYSLTTKNKVLSSYDIVSVCPETEKAFLTACSGSYEAVDIISLDIKAKIPYHLKSKSLSQAISNGIFFELPYAPAIINSSFRRFWLSNAATIAKSTRGKNLLLSSDADNYFDLRSPYDAAMLLSITGLNLGLAKQAISAAPRLCLFASDSRKYAFKSVVLVENISVPTLTDHLNEPSSLEPPNKKIKSCL
ncbi:hypothetical protein BB561_001587 [Smittium simulii]|uniref:Uncharacterized protein n=1 Tax=Smittium simulii TaxID=133385 RepID=A0A2T9YU36_9FUNG|nr:hypothetical protein BB561_001587 [Smittium simulii]